MRQAVSPLLVEAQQPTSLRECYELLARFVEDLGGPTPLSAAHLDSATGTRAGYLVAAARLLAGVRVHPSWIALEGELAARTRSPSQVTLFAADSGANAFDELAMQWGFRKGVDSAKLVQIATYGES